MQELPFLRGIAISISCVVLVDIDMGVAGKILLLGRQCLGIVRVVFAVNEKGRLLRKGDAFINGAGVTAKRMVSALAAIGIAIVIDIGVRVRVRITALVVDRDQQFETVVERGRGIFVQTFFKVHGRTIVQFLRTKDVEGMPSELAHRHAN